MYQASLSSFLAPLRTHLGAFPSQNQLIVSLAAPAFLTFLGPKVRKMRGRRDHWFSKTRHQDGMNSCSVGA
uniref:Tubby-like F-box protein n=1 Tax=Rhizophora mucronata TaxID=61149 RepID=A0A2P2MFS1_RHIMU